MDRLGWLVAGLLLALYGALLGTYGVNFPHADDFSQILSIPHFFLSKDTFAERVAYIFSLSVEHRIATMRLAALAQVGLFGGLNFVLLMAVGATLLAAAASLVVWASEGAHRPFVAAIAVALLYSPANFEAQYWATGALQHFCVVAYAFGAISCLGRPGVNRTIAAFALALAAAFTSANGLMTFPAAAVALWAAGRRRAAMAWTLFAICLFAVYFVGYERPDYQRTALGTLVDPLRFVRFFVASVGSMAVELWPALFVGTVLIAGWIWLLVWRRESVSPVLLGWFAFITFSDGAMAFGRSSLGEEFALLSRYRVYSDMGILVTLAAVLHQVPPQLARRILWVAMPLSVAWFGVSLRANGPAFVHASLLQQVRLDQSAANGHADYGPWPKPDFGRFLLSTASKRGYYDPTRVANPPLELIEDERKLESLGSSTVRVDNLDQGAIAISIVGFVPAKPERLIFWLANPEHQYRATLATKPNGVPPFAGDGRFFWGTVAIATLAPGSYRIGYALSGDPASGVYWSEHRVLSP